MVSDTLRKESIVDKSKYIELQAKLTRCCLGFMHEVAFLSIKTEKVPISQSANLLFLLVSSELCPLSCLLI